MAVSLSIATRCASSRCTVINSVIFLSLAHLEHTPTSSWSYSETSSGNWYSPDETVSWESAAPGAFPEIAATATSRFYRADVTMPSDLSQFGAYEVGIRTGYGYVLYVNGEQALTVSAEE